MGPAPHRTRQALSAAAARLFRRTALLLPSRGSRPVLRERRHTAPPRANGARAPTPGRCVARAQSARLETVRCRRCRRRAGGAWAAPCREGARRLPSGPGAAGAKARRGEHGRVAARGAARRAGVGGRAVSAAGPHQGPLVWQYGERGGAAGGALRGAPAQRRGHAAGHRPQVRRHGKARAAAALSRHGGEAALVAFRCHGCGDGESALAARWPPPRSARIAENGDYILPSESALRWYNVLAAAERFSPDSFRPKCSPCSPDSRPAQKRCCFCIP